MPPNSIPTSKGFVSARSPETLASLRSAFVDADEKPTFKELSERFGIPLNTIYARSADERWQEQREARLQAAQVDAGTLALLATAGERTNARLIQGFSDAILLTLEKLQVITREIGDSQKSPTTKASTVGSITFSLLNLANSCKAIGIVSFDRNLEKLGKEGNNKWNPQMLHQINVTIGELKTKAEQAKQQVTTEVSATAPTS